MLLIILISLLYNDLAVGKIMWS